VFKQTKERNFVMAVKEQEIEEAEAEEVALRSQIWKHEAMVEWLNEQFEIDLDSLPAAEVIAYAFAKRVEWRKSNDYLSLVDDYRTETAQRKEQEAAAREAAKLEKEAEKAAEKAAAAEADEDGDSEPPAKTGRAKKAAATPAAPTKATRKGKASAGEESPFA
jgi:hypothetical protein